MFRSLFNEPKKKTKILAAGQVVPAVGRCVQCGICSYNCPIGIDVRAHALRGIPVNDKHCLTCGECVARCPRGVLSFEKSPPLEGAGAAQRSGVDCFTAGVFDLLAANPDASATRPSGLRS
jgi:ferredoxin